MGQDVLDHYLEFSTYTYPGEYKNVIQYSLPDNIRKIGSLVRGNFIHRTTLVAGNTGTNADLRFGDMNLVPWWRQPEDDILVTASAMLSELYRRDKRGFVFDRSPQDKLVLTCRFVAIMMACILKAKGIPSRVRAGHAPYFDMGDWGKLSVDHWINQYWDSQEKRWVTIDVDGSLSLASDFDPFDMPDQVFDFPAQAWLDIRSGKRNSQLFFNAAPERGAIVVLWSLFYDFHCLMNNEIIYPYGTKFGSHRNFASMSEQELSGIDNIAELMLNPDENFNELKQIWESNKDYRILYGSLL